MSDQNTPGGTGSSGSSPWNGPDSDRPAAAGGQGQYGQGQYGATEHGHDEHRGGSAYPQQAYDSTAGHGTPPSYSQHSGAPAHGGHAPIGPLPQGMAIAALVCGILGLFGAWIPFIGVLAGLLALVGVILGIMALRKVKRGTGGGKGLAIGGIVTGILAVLLATVVTVVMAITLAEVAKDPRFKDLDFKQIQECSQKPTKAEQEACMDALLPSTAPTPR